VLATTPVPSTGSTGRCSTSVADTTTGPVIEQTWDSTASSA
jgi:hypothetical protein